MNFILLFGIMVACIIFAKELGKKAARVKRDRAKKDFWYWKLFHKSF